MVSKLVKPYRSLETGNRETRKDDILRAAISAFVGLTNPTKRDCNQIEDLALSLLPFTSENTRRFVAAALCEKPQAPAMLVKRLCEEPVDVCAPLLLRSPALLPIDFVSIIGRTGPEHARVIAKRKHLPNEVIEALACVNDPLVRDRASKGNVGPDIDPITALGNIKPVSAEAARDFLRTLMDPATVPSTAIRELPDQDMQPIPAMLPREAARKLVDLSLREQEGLFLTALADMTGLSYPRALKLIRRPSAAELGTVLKSLEIDGPTAFLVCSIFYPQICSSRSEMRLFLERHDAMDCDSATAMVRGWKAEEIALSIVRRGANVVIQAESEGVAKAS